MHRPRRVVAALLVVVAAAAFGACDNDDDEESTPDGSSVEAPNTPSTAFRPTTSDPGRVTPTTF